MLFWLRVNLIVSSNKSIYRVQYLKTEIAYDELLRLSPGLKMPSCSWAKMICNLQNAVTVEMSYEIRDNY